MVVLEARYERVFKKPWRGYDVIVWPYGRLRPKDYGEVLFSEEWNYLLKTLYWLHLTKRFYFASIRTPLACRLAFRVSPLIAFLVYVTWFWPTERRTERPDIVAEILAREIRTAFPHVTRPLLAIERRLLWEAGPGTVLGGEYRVSLVLRSQIRAVDDVLFREVRATTASIDTHTGGAVGDLYLYIMYREPMHRAAVPRTSRVVPLTLAFKAAARRPHIGISTWERSVSLRVE